MFAPPRMEFECVGDQVDDIPLLEPIILTDEIIDTARSWVTAWQAKCDGYTGEDLRLVCSAVLKSPVDYQERSASLFVCSGLTSRAKTFPPGIKNPDGQPIAPEGHYVVVLDESSQDVHLALLLAILLHELTHVVDPLFLEDCAERETLMPSIANEPYSQYQLKSEQRAFTAMWIAALNDALAAGSYFGRTDFIQRAAGVLREFDFFWAYCLCDKRLRRQGEYHFAKMEEHLRAAKNRQGSGSLPLH